MGEIKLGQYQLTEINYRRTERLKQKSDFLCMQTDIGLHPSVNKFTVSNTSIRLKIVSFREKMCLISNIDIKQLTHYQTTKF